jgi:acetyltransferase-like isoleucine patch superfamily enzyme/acyl carrier protein
VSPLSFVASMSRKLALRGCDVVGDDVRLVGKPSIESRGHLELGRGALLCSRPIAIHLATGTDGALFIGDGVTIGYGCSIVAEGLVTIGEGTRIGPFVMVCDVEDDGVSGWQRTRRPIVIGRNVRIGSKVTVLPGTYIGDGVDVPAGSVVSGTTATKGGASRALASASGAGAALVSDVSRRIAQVLSDVFDRSATAPPSLELERISGWGADGALRLLLAVEKEFGTTIPDEEWLAVRSLGDLVNTIERRTAHVPYPCTPPTLATGQVE